MIFNVNSQKIKSIALTGASSRTIVFYSISGGTLYTDEARRTEVSTNVKYTNQTFYYKANESKPSASYIYNYGDGAFSSSLPSKDTLSNYITHMQTLFGSGTVWSGTSAKTGGFIKLTVYYYYDLSSGSSSSDLQNSTSRHRVMLDSL